MVSNENLLKAQNSYIDQLQRENTELKGKLRKAADDTLTANAMRAAMASNYNKVCEECNELKKTVSEMRSAAAQRSRNDIEISRLRAHNIQLRSQLDALRKEPGHTSSPMAFKWGDKTFYNNEDGISALVDEVLKVAQEAAMKEFHTLQNQINVLSGENRHLEHDLRAAERALEEKEGELEALRVHCGERSERNADRKPAFTPPPAKKLELTQCTPEQYEETLKCLHEMENHITGFLDRMMKR